LQPFNIDTTDYYNGKKDFDIPESDANGTKFNNNPGAANMFGTQFEYLIKRPIDTTPWQNNFTLFSPTNLTADNVTVDTIFNKGIRDYLIKRPPSIQTVDWYGGLYFWMMYLYSELMSLTGYQFRIYNRIFDGTFSIGKGLYAIRLHRFTYEAGGNNQYLPVMSVVDVATGEEKYRRVLENGGADERYFNNTINGLWPVKDGIAQSQSSTATKSIFEQMNIGSCFWIQPDPNNFPAWKKLIDATDEAIHSGAINKKTSNYSRDIINQWIGNEIGSNNILKAGLVVDLGEAHLIAVDKPDGEAENHLFGLSFLPWNNYAYNIYDLQNRQYVAPNPINSSNFMTVLKLIGLGYIAFEIIEMLINYI